MEEQKKKDPTSNHEVDPFTAFMFGKSRLKAETLDETINEEKQDTSFSTDDWIFGRHHRSHSKTERDGHQQINHVVNQFLNQLNTEEVMKNVDLFVETAQELKPLWKKLSPHIQKWIK